MLFIYTPYWHFIQTIAALMNEACFEKFAVNSCSILGNVSRFIASQHQVALAVTQGIIAVSTVILLR